MSAFNYTALSPIGQEIKGVIEGDSARQVRQKLRDQQLIPLEVTEVRKESVSRFGTFTFQRKQRLTTSDLALITRQLATLLSAGIPLEEAVLGVAEQTEKRKVKSILIAVRARILEGHTLAAGLLDFPQAFSPLYRATIAAGESSGHLDKVLMRLADYTEQQHHTKQRVLQALIYPMVMTLVSLAIVVFLMVYVVPSMVTVFIDSHQALPFSTISLIAISNILKNYGLYFLAILLISIALFRYALKRANFQEFIHNLLLKLPVIGKMIQTINTARFSRTLGILSSSSVAILEAMRISAELITNIPIQKAISNAILQVREGANIHRALKHTHYFPAMSIHLIASGEASGQLEAMLERAANHQEQAMQSLISSTLSLFEPLLILIMGAIVLFIVLAIMLPIFSIDQYMG